MKKLAAWLLCLALCCAMGMALAESYQEPTLYDASQALGFPTHYLLYDRAFYESEDAQPGTVVQLKYVSSVYGERTYKRTVNVYLPYGYEEQGEERYPVLYFFHGRGCNQDTLLGNPQTKNALDHMISTGVARPFILVAPTYYYDVRRNLMDWELFTQELRTELMPLVEGTCRTFALSPDEAGFQASRDQRAFCGFSQGSMLTWYLVERMADCSRYFLPFSGAAQDVSGIQRLLEQEDAPEIFIYMASGGPEDTTYEGCVALAQQLYADTAHFSVGTDMRENNLFCCLSDNIHQDLTTRYYLYNAFVDGLFAE